MTMKTAFGSILPGILLILGFPLAADTLFICIEDDSRLVDRGLPSAAKEGLLAGLFDYGHIVFDDWETDLEEWKRGNPARLAARAEAGGADHLVIVTVDNRYYQVRKKEALLTGIDSIAHYYLYRVRDEVLLGKGSVEGSNAGREEELHEPDLGFTLGKDLSLKLDEICRRNSLKTSIPAVY